MKSNKHICMITQSPYPMDPRVRRQAEKLEKEGYSIDILCVNTDGSPKIQIYGNITAYRIIQYIRHEDQINYFVFSIKFFFLCFSKLQSLYSERKYNLIQVHNMPDYHIFIGLLQKIFFRVPLVLDIHDLTVDLFREKWSGRKSNLLLPLVKFTERISCSFASHVITVTDECVNILVSRGVPREKITLILNTANEELFVFPDKKDFSEIKKDLKLFYHGTIAERFGLHIVIQALPQIEKSIPNTQFIVYGKYDQKYKEELLDLIKKLGLEAKVHLNSSAPIEYILEILKSFDIGVVPYMGTAYMHLSLSTKAFEYIASGVPVISSRLRSMENVFSSKSISFFEAGNPDDLAKKTIELCNNPELRKTAIHSAFKDLEKVSWKVMSNKYFNLIRSLIKN
ncbi:MAG: glycosyltransferase family 4 protein [Ignavibacterium sp.]|nr:glycosyltransferase family 4 protein [Ignavibacterium sp.]